MGENSKIEWTDHTFNPWIGCTKVSAGCANCYAERWGDRYGVKWGPGGERRRTSPAYWRQPLAWNRKAEREGVRLRVFCASLADWLDMAVPTQWRVDLLNLILATPYLDWLLLTKRIESWSARLHEAMYGAGLAAGWLNSNQVPHNVWLGTSVEDQATADQRIPHLLAVPAAVRFVSCEPLLGPVDLRRVTVIQRSSSCEDHVPWLRECDDPVLDPPCGGLDWVIVGGESGPGARPMHPDWARSLRDQCAAAGVPFFFKQWGRWAPCDPSDWHGLGPTGNPPQLAVGLQGQTAGGFLGRLAEQREAEGWRPMSRVGKRAAGRLLDGREHNEFPH